MARWHILALALCSYLGVAWAATLGVVLTEGGFVEGESKKLGLFGSYVDIFRGIPFAAPPKTLEDPQPHPGWDGKMQLLNAFGLGFYFCSPLFNLVHMGNSTAHYSDWSQRLGRLCCLCSGLREERMGGQTCCNQRMELMPLTGTCCLPFLLSGTLEAKTFKKRCMQMKLTQTDVRGSEDCLYLNIWIPQGRREISTKLPVMVFIYGGAFLVGGSQGANFLDNYLYDGEEIAVRGNVIVVTVNYRLGPLGFLSTGDENLPGNYGLKDQHMAIAWVKRNIKAFGGDPDNITIFGESAGAVSVSLQTLSPKNKGLFKRAISQSGVGVCSWAIQRDPLFWAKKLGEKVGCSTDNTAILANCLRSSDPKTLTLAYHLQLTNLPMPLVHTLALTPVVDGDFLPDMPEKLFANAADIDYLAGVNNMDGHIFAGVDLPAINRPLVKITAEQVYDLIKGLTVDRGEAGANATYNIYTQSWGDKPSQEVMKKTVVDLVTDYIFLIPTQWALNLHLQNAQSGKTYSYVFSQPSRMPVYPSWVGADHADDLQYVFGKPFATPLGYLPKHRTVSKAMIAYWTNFARSGDPNKGHSDVPVSWPAYSNKGKYYLDINNEMNKNSVKQDLRSEYVSFWNSVYRQLPQVANISQSELMF
ncbi:bile salt-activated lipase isoform X1 [Corvus cornix cornix]|uniref:bile salt-activated lipase isoform X1 n=1 Tax=Corvus cornix cornix TaxID=932674 RepID=UPI0019518BD7|nr:bile salt-activated lipase isoform X1 [Corvus cornix cornix]XP_039417929.1 bile salt-activated lipase isoform X1 [Corvus cornix cornix]